MISIKRILLILKHFIFISLLIVNPSLAGGLFRLNPSTPKNLIEEIYNNVMLGNDRLSDIENYMSSSLKGNYKKAIKTVNSGKKCKVPRVISNDIFSGKLKGFNVSEGETKNSKTQVIVKIDTDFRNLSGSDQLKNFDPTIYERITFTLTKRFIDWKIDNIVAYTPDLDSPSKSIQYKTLDLRQALKECARI